MSLAMFTQLVAKVRNMVRTLSLDLRGINVLTEAATGAYVVTPLLAAVAGAQVVAYTRDSRHGAVDQVRKETALLAEELGVSSRIRIVEKLEDEDFANADLITNSGHLRPLDGAFIHRLKPGAVVALMYENWEYRAADLDLGACRAHGIEVVATNERHPLLRVFDYLGPLAVAGLLRLGAPVAQCRILVVCSNAFAPFIVRALVGCGSFVDVLGPLTGPEFEEAVSFRERESPREYDAAIIAETPGPVPVLGFRERSRYSIEDLGILPAVVQIWGDIDREAFQGSRFYPQQPPRRGHMGMLLSELGCEPVLRLQAGGLKAGEERLHGVIARGVEPFGEAVLVHSRFDLFPQEKR